MNTVDVSGFTGMIGELSKIAGRDYFDVLLPQIGALLKACINRTPVRTVGQIAKRVSARGSYIEFADGTIISVWKKAISETLDGDRTSAPGMFFDESTYPQYSKRWPKNSRQPAISGGKSWHNMDTHRWSDARWARYKEKLRLRAAAMKQWMEAGKAARGLARKSWWQIAEDLGLDPGIAAAYVRQAHATGENGDIRPFKEGFAAKLLEQGAAIIELRNTNPLLVEGRVDGEGILLGAMRDRQKAFLIDLEKGVFDDLERRAQRYPGIFVG